jgi:hypothetical protein
MRYPHGGTAVGAVSCSLRCVLQRARLSFCIRLRFLSWVQIHSRTMYVIKYAIIACHMLFVFVVDRSAPIQI